MEPVNCRRFNEILNFFKDPEAVYYALLALAKPSIQQTSDMGQKRQIIVGAVLTLSGETQVSQQPA